MAEAGRVRAAALAVGCGLLLAGCAADVSTPAGDLVDGGAARSDAAPSGSPGPGGSAPAPSPAPAPLPEPTADGVRGLWAAGDDDAGRILYELDGDGTFTRVSLLHRQGPEGTFRFQDVVEGTFRLDGTTLVLRPTAGVQTVQDPRSDRGSAPVSTPRTDLAREVHAVELREDGTVLVLTPPDGAPVTLHRQGS